MNVGTNVYRRHIDQIITKHIEYDVDDDDDDDDDDECMDYDFPDSHEILRRPNTTPKPRYVSRYPQRNRKPVSRYGIS